MRLQAAQDKDNSVTDGNRRDRAINRDWLWGRADFSGDFKITYPVRAVNGRGLCITVVGSPERTV